MPFGHTKEPNRSMRSRRISASSFAADVVRSVIGGVDELLLATLVALKISLL